MDFSFLQRIVLFHILGHICLKSVSSETIGYNMFQDIGYVSNNVYEGLLCLDFSGVFPTCGWRIRLTSDQDLAGVHVYSNEIRMIREDMRNFVSQSIAEYQDLSAWYYDCYSTLVTLDLLLYTYPIIDIRFSCVCPPSNCTGNNNIGTTPTTPSVYPGQHIEAPTKIKLEKVIGHCYNGTHLSTMQGVSRVLVCASKCIPDQGCTGINFWKSSARCDLVREIPDMSLGVVNDCQYYQVVWKA